MDREQDINFIYEGGVLRPQGPVDLPEGTRGVAHIRQSDAGEAPLLDLARLAETFGSAPDWPADGAAQLDHYLYGSPKHHE